MSSFSAEAAEGLDTATLSDMPSETGVPEGEEVVQETTSEIDSLNEAAAQVEAEPEESDPEDIEASSDEEKSAEDKKQSSKRDKSARVRELANAKRELEFKLAQQEAIHNERMQMLQWQLKRDAEERKAEREEMLRLQREQHDWAKRKREAEEEANLSDVERARRAFLRESAEFNKKEWEATHGKELAELKAWKENQARQAEEAQAAAERLQRITALENQVASQVSRAVFHDLPKESVETLSGQATDFLANYSITFQRTPEQAAQEFRAFLDQYHSAKNKAIAEAAKKKGVQAGKPGTKKPAVAGKLPPMKELKEKYGVDNYFDYIDKYGSREVSV